MGGWAWMAIVVHLCKRSVSPEPEGADSSTVNLGERLGAALRPQ